MDREERELLIRIDERTARIEASLSDHERRIRGLERWRWAIAATVGALLSLLGFKTLGPPG